MTLLKVCCCPRPDGKCERGVCRGRKPRGHSGQSRHEWQCTLVERGVVRYVYARLGKIRTRCTLDGWAIILFASRPSNASAKCTAARRLRMRRVHVRGGYCGESAGGQESRRTHLSPVRGLRARAPADVRIPVRRL